MPFFDANKICITIEYDDNMCLVGGSLRGVVNLFVKGMATLCGASLRYRAVEGSSLAGDVSADLDCYVVEYVLFGARSALKAKPVIVTSGHYSYPFAIPIPNFVPPTQRFGGANANASGYGGTSGPAVRTEHLVEVVVYVALSWKDKHQSRHAPCVVSCTTPSLLLAPNNGMEGHMRSGDSMVLPGKGFFSKLFNSGPTKSKEQADCDLFIYNTTVSLADSPFLHFAIRGKTNCPYRVELVRVVQYTPEVPRDNSQTEGGAPEAVQKKPPIIHEQVISSTTMPPLDSQQQGVIGKLLISPFAQEHSVTFNSRTLRVTYYVTVSLQYIDRATTSFVPPEKKIRIPVSIYHGTFEEAIAGTVEGGYPVTGAVMGYDAPPAGEHALFRPAAPVTDSGVTSTQWSDPNHEPQIIRPTLPDQNAPTSSRGNAPKSVSVAAAPPANASKKADPPTVDNAPSANRPSAQQRRLFDAPPPLWVTAQREAPTESLDDFEVISNAASPPNAEGGSTTLI